ncbi:NUC156 family protein [Pelomyxa schiedti]|nr:NUC156 family protein [Pelomyxa schiedti]
MSPLMLSCELLAVCLVFGLAGALEWGLVTGGMYADGEQSFETNLDNIMCEYQQLGVNWIRIESDWYGTPDYVYQNIISSAHARGIKVNVIVATRYCGSDTDTAAIDAWINTYIEHLNSTIISVFSGVDSIELANEPNIEEDGCGDGVSRFRVSPNAFAWLCRRVMQWKAASSRPELIVSGGILNTYTTESFWPTFFASGAFFSYPGELPYDLFGIHPYDVWDLDQTCINTGSTNCFSSWQSSVTAGLKSIIAQLDTATKTTTTRMFVTEVGFQEPLNGYSCTSNCNCVLNDQQQAAGMKAAWTAISASGCTNTALWYDYRDDSAEKFGLRGVWDGSSYPAKQDVCCTAILPLVQITCADMGDTDTAMRRGASATAGYRVGNPVQLVRDDASDSDDDYIPLMQAPAAPTTTTTTTTTATATATTTTTHHPDVHGEPKADDASCSTSDDELPREANLQSPPAQHLPNQLTPDDATANATGDASAVEATAENEASDVNSTAAGCHRDDVDNGAPPVDAANEAPTAAATAAVTSAMPVAINTTTGDGGVLSGSSATCDVQSDDEGLAPGMEEGFIALTAYQSVCNASLAKQRNQRRGPRRPLLGGGESCLDIIEDRRPDGLSTKPWTENPGKIDGNRIRLDPGTYCVGVLPIARGEWCMCRTFWCNNAPVGTILQAVPPLSLPKHRHIEGSKRKAAWLEIRSLDGPPPHPDAFKELPPEADILKTICGLSIVMCSYYSLHSMKSSHIKKGVRTSVVVIGDADTGKSTFCRYITNVLLEKYPEVGFMDLDCGQPEFGPATLISYHTAHPFVTFSHQKCRLKLCCMTANSYCNSAFFIGDTSPGSDPDHYLNCAQNLILWHNKNVPCTRPLVVNMNGWIHGVGVQILKLLLNWLQPSHIVQLNIVPKLVGGVIDELDTTKHFLENEFAKPKGQMFGMARARRELQAICYFEWNAVGVSRQIPYLIQWSALAISFQGIQVPPSQAFYALNGSIVGLCVAPDTMTFVQRNTPAVRTDFPTFIVGSPVPFPCVGLGIIREIDMVKKRFYVVTPVSPDHLKWVNVIVKGYPFEGPTGIGVIYSPEKGTLVSAPYYVWGSLPGPLTFSLSEKLSDL